MKSGFSIDFYAPQTKILEGLTQDATFRSTFQGVSTRFGLLRLGSITLQRFFAKIEYSRP
jgi:hypothetical protein